VKEPGLASRTRNALIRSLRGLGERGFALLTQRWTTLQNVTASPSRIADIAEAALVLLQFEHKMIELKSLGNLNQCRRQSRAFVGAAAFQPPGLSSGSERCRIPGGPS
jgi:hypothetical protein